MTSVILMTHLDENRPYFELALEAVLESVGTDFEVIAISSAETAPAPSPRARIIHDRELNTATLKVHHGASQMAPHSKNILILSDDVVVSKHMLKELADYANHTRVILNPMTNGENLVRYVTNLALEKPGQRWAMPLHAEIRDADNWREELKNYRSPYQAHPLIVTQPWNSFFCTLIPRSVWDQVGPLDPALETRHNDEDYCYRAGDLGIPSAIHFGAFAFHFGSRTLSKTCRPGEQDEASRAFFAKYAKK